MKKVITKSEGIKSAIRIILLCLIVAVWPLRLFHEDIAVGTGAQPAEQIEISGSDDNAAQAFVTSYGHLQYIDLKLADNNSDGKFWFRLFDSKQQLVCEQLVDTAKCTSSDCRICINRELEQGSAYVYLLQADEGSAVTVMTEDTTKPGSTSSGVMTYQESSVDNRNLLVSYIYREPLRKGKSALVMFGLLLAMLLSDIMITKITKKTGIGSALVPDTWTYKVVCNPLIIFFSAWGVIAVGPMHIFGKHIFDIAILEAGIVMLTITLLYIVNRRYATQRRGMAIEHTEDKLSDVLQTVFIALAIWAAINYQNGTADVFHDIAFRQLLIFMGLALIVTYTGSELWNIYNLVGLVSSGIFSAVYVHMNTASQVDSYHVTSLRLLGVLIVVCTILAINTVSTVSSVKKTRISAYGILTAVMMIAFVWRRNTRWWPVIMVIGLTVYFIRYCAWKRRSALLINIARGMSLNFIVCTLWCLMHRPFLSFLLTRYPHMFFTVTETATYLAAALAASTVILFDRYNRTGKIRSCTGQLLLFGIEMVYALFTMSRTVILAAAISFFVMIIALAGRGMKHAAKCRLEVLLSCVLVTLWCFPICFSMQRIIPACVAEPVIYDYEKQNVPDEIIRGDVKDSMYYMTFERFANYFCYKMLGTSEHMLDLNKYNVAGTGQTESVQLSQNSMTASSCMILTSDELNTAVQNGLTVARSDVVQTSTAETAGSADSTDQNGDLGEGISNGRNSIFKSYISQMNLWGHDAMGATLEDGSTASHAHNIYLQVSYDNGIIVGIIFVIWMAATIIRSFGYLKRRYKTDYAAGLPLAVTVTFAAAGLVEWVSHPCIPIGLMFLLILPPLIYMPKDGTH